MLSNEPVRARSMEMRAEVPATHAEPDRETPRGTLAILLGYVLVIIGLWGYAYITLILRS